MSAPRAHRPRTPRARIPRAPRPAPRPVVSADALLHVYSREDRDGRRALLDAAQDVARGSAYPLLSRAAAGLLRAVVG